MMNLGPGDAINVGESMVDDGMMVEGSLLVHEWTLMMVKKSYILKNIKGSNQNQPCQYANITTFGVMRIHRGFWSFWGCGQTGSGVCNLAESSVFGQGCGPKFFNTGFCFDRGLCKQNGAQENQASPINKSNQDHAPQTHIIDRCFSLLIIITQPFSIVSHHESLSATHNHNAGIALPG